jgi:3-dehydroquinate dehydratase/shikimate dehydrogenase
MMSVAPERAGPWICASIGARTHDEARRALVRAREAGADLAELRVDRLEERPELARLLRDRPLPVLITARPVWEGGAFRGSEEDRRRLIEEACALGAEWVDVEHRAGWLPRRGATRVLLSFHDPACTPEDPIAVAREMAARGPDLVKIAAAARGADDVARLARAQRGLGSPGVILGMGPWAEPLRVLFRRLGAALCYAPLAAGEETAPGQVPIDALLGAYRAREIDERARVVGVLCEPGAGDGPVLSLCRALIASGADVYAVRIALDDPASLPELQAALMVDEIVAAPSRASGADVERWARGEARRIAGQP